MNTIGFCLSLRSLLRSHDLDIIKSNYKEFGVVFIIILSILCCIGIDKEEEVCIKINFTNY